MAEFTHKDLKIARESRNVAKWQLANELGVSEDTIYRWEKGEQRPDPDIVGNIEKILSYPGLWHRWMLSHYDSYRERYTDVPEVEHLTALVVRMKHEMMDVLSLSDDLERDSLNGKIDKPELWQMLKREASEAVAAIQQTLERIP